MTSFATGIKAVAFYLWPFPVDKCILQKYTIYMLILPEPISFEWDTGNINKNLDKHNVTNQEAEELFSNEPFLVHEDSKHSIKEQRFRALGKTKSGRMLFVTFTIRNNKVRIISVRDMNRKEEVIYETIEKNSRI
jgi:uncharacterized DUF497 family protein